MVQVTEEHRELAEGAVPAMEPGTRRETVEYVAQLLADEGERRDAALLRAEEAELVALRQLGEKDAEIERLTKLRNLRTQEEKRRDFEGGRREALEEAAKVVEHRAAEYRKRPIDINDHPVSWALLDDVLNAHDAIRSLIENTEAPTERRIEKAAYLERHAASQAEEPEALRLLRSLVESVDDVTHGEHLETILAAWEADRRALAEAREREKGWSALRDERTEALSKRLAEAEERAEKAEEGHREAAEEAIDALQRVAEAEENHKRKLRDVIAGCGEDPDTFAFGPLQAVDNLRSRLADAEERAEKAEAEMREQEEHIRGPLAVQAKEKQGRIQSLVAERDQLRERLAALLSAINWALGSNGRFPMRAEGQGAYWWRPELQRRAGLEYDGERFVLDALPKNNEA